MTKEKVCETQKNLTDSVSVICQLEGEKLKK